MPRYRLTWGDGEVMYVTASSIEAAVAVCQKGQPLTWTQEGCLNPALIQACADLLRQINALPDPLYLDLNMAEVSQKSRFLDIAEKIFKLILIGESSLGFTCTGKKDDAAN